MRRLPQLKQQSLPLRSVERLYIPSLTLCQMENQNLRLAIEDLTVTFEEFQSTMTRALYEKSQSTNTNTSTLSCLEQAKYVESRLDATAALLTATPKDSTDSTNYALAESSSGPGRYSSPSRGGYHNHILLGTPTARPLNWIVKQATTEVKLLRKRAENLHWYIPPATDEEEKGREGNDEDEDDDDHLLLTNKENNNVTNEGGSTSVSLPHQFSDLTKRYQGKLIKLKHQLEEAVSVICEQDRLIHAGTPRRRPRLTFLSSGWEHVKLHRGHEQGVIIVELCGGGRGGGGGGW
jgi:hypothetical protein